MIFDASTFASDVTLKTDLVVVGSGAGGLTAAMAAAEKGVRTLLIEGGEYLLPTDMSQREEEMFPRLMQESGGRTTNDRAVKVFQGRGVGGSTLHNINLCKRIPPSIRARWAATHGMSKLDDATWDALYDEVEAMLEVSAIPREAWSTHNLVIERGVTRLGWRGGGLLHNRTGCMSSGFCEVGCRYNAKNNAFKIVLPRAINAGVEVISNCVAVRVVHAAGAARGIEAVALDPKTRAPLRRITVDAKRVCVSASATGTPALLLRSGIRDRSGVTGTTLRIHPALIAAGVFDEPIRAWQGIPQSYECTEHLDLDGAARDDASASRVWIVPAFAHPIGTATMVPGHGAAHRRLMERYPHLAVLTGMIHDLTAGTVRPRGDFGVAIDYWPNEADRRQLALGVWASAKVLFAAGATEVMVPTRIPRTLLPTDELEPLKQLPIEKGDLDVTGVHPMSSVPMGDDASRAPVGSDGKHHDVENLWVADASLFPTSIGVPPQLSVYAMGLHVGRALAR